MNNESIQILLENANAYFALAQSLRSSGVSSWVSYHRQGISCINKAKNIETYQAEILGFEEEITLKAA